MDGGSVVTLKEFFVIPEEDFSCLGFGVIDEPA
jgi:hypothetical protein